MTGTSTGRIRRRFLAPLSEYALLLAVLMIAILYLVRPWWEYFGTGLANHWDPLLMGSWMAFNAHNILDGRFLIPDFNANFFYPHAYTLAFSEPLWPQSFVYAAVYAASNNPYLAFNSTFLLFWALSGVCMFALLRGLKVPRWIAYVGSLVFCVMPYRLGYYVEFNMTLVLGIPLAYLYLIRWLRTQTYHDAIAFAVIFWLSAISCLYYTIIMVVPLAFLLTGYVVYQPRLLSDARFWRGGLTALLIIAALCGIFLYPYAVLRLDGYVRTLDEQAIYAAQPLAYLQPVGLSPANRWTLVPVTRSETDLFPGLLAAGLFGLYLWRFRILLRPEAGSCGVVSGLAWVRIGMWTMFWPVLMLGAWSADARLFDALSWTAVPVLTGILVVSIGIHLLRRFRDDTGVVLSSLALGALAAFALSLGPQVTTGVADKIVMVGNGPIETLYRMIPFFGVIRVTARFAIVVLTFVVVAGCLALAAATASRRGLRWLIVPLAAFAVAEARNDRPYEFVDYADIAGSQVQARLRRDSDRIALLQMPMGHKYFEAIALQNSIGKFDYLLNGHSGFLPTEHEQLARDIYDGRVGKATRWLREIWPVAHIVVDRTAHDWWRRFSAMPFHERRLRRAWKLVDQDDRYNLYRLKPVTERRRRINRRLRSDVLERNPVLRFTARPIGPVRTNVAYTIAVNGHDVTRGHLESGWRRYAVTIPAGIARHVRGDTVSLTLTDERDKAKWAVRDIDFDPLSP